MVKRLRWPCLLFCLAAASGACLGAAPPADQASTEARLDAVRSEIRALAVAQRKAGGARDALVARLADQADALAAASKALHRAEAELAERQQALETLETERRAVQARLDGQRDALAELLRAAYTLGHGSDLRVLLGQLAPCAVAAAAADCADNDLLGRLNRALAYSRYFQRDRLTRIKAIVADLAALDTVRDRIRAESTAREQALVERRQRTAALESERAAQQKLLVEAEAAIHSRGQRLQTLGEEEKSLNALLERLRNVFADIPRQLADERPFGKRRGALPWPLSGAAQHENHGLLIAAKPGSRVRAVAHGRVAYAAWLRGYGMLLIVDHGDGWMSLYGGNESLLREVGDWVDDGDVIATSGRGEGGVAGLYFGLRHDGKAVDPKPWLRRKP